jgi:uncharacterized protein (UPF0332 family)
MSFDWSHYLDLAEELIERAANSPNAEADLRSAVSRAYYGAFHQARLYLKDAFGIAIERDAYSHAQVRRAFQDRQYYKIAANLSRMRVDRNKADYDDTITNLLHLARENLRRANNVISELDNI